MLLLFSSFASAEQVTLAWDDPHNDTAEVGGYRLYYWQPTWEMPASVEVGRQTTYTLTNLEAGKTYTFAITVHDGQGDRESLISNEVSMTFPPPNTPPIAYDGTLNTAAGTPSTSTLRATDADGDALTYRLLSTGSQGTAVLSDATTGTYTYTPQPRASGTDTFTFQVNDGTVDSNVATVMLTISPSNDAPVAAADHAITPEDTAVSLAVLANDSDVDGDGLTVTTVSPATAGTATTDGTTVTYTPNPDVSGTDTFTYTVSDGSGGVATGTVTITVTPVNDIPVAAADSATTSEATAVTLSVLANDTDVDGDTLTVTAVSPATGGTAVTDGTSVTYTPNDNFHGTDTFTYTVSDGSGGTAIGTVTITVRSVNLAPVAYDGSLYTTENTAVSGTLSASDANGDTLTYRLVASSATPQITLAWDDPHNDPAEVGGYRIYYWQPYWEMPASVDIGPHTTHTLTGLEAGQPYTFAITVHDGQGGRESTLSNEVSTPGVSPASGPHGTVTLTDTTTGAYTYTPPSQATGTDTFTFQVNDGTVDSNVATVRVTITSPLDEVIDTDGDGLSDDVERDVYGTNPLLADTDADGVADGEELDLYGTDPLLADTDADGIPDGAEIAAGTDPTAPDSSAPLSLWRDYQVTMLLRSDDNDALGVLFRYQDPNNYYRFSWDRQRAYRRLVKCENGTFTLLAEDNVRYVSRRTYQLHIVAQGPHLEVWIDNKQIFAITDTSFEQGTIALYSWGNAGSQFEAVRVETFPMEVVLLAIGTHDGPSANWTVIDEGTVSGPSAWVVEQSALVQTGNIYSQPMHREDLAKLGTFALYEIVDTDGDGLPDDVERDVYGTDPFLADTDADGFEDGEELEYYDTDPLLADTE